MASRFGRPPISGSGRYKKHMIPSSAVTIAERNGESFLFRSFQLLNTDVYDLPGLPCCLHSREKEHF